MLPNLRKWQTPLNPRRNYHLDTMQVGQSGDVLTVSESGLVAANHHSVNGVILMVIPYVIVVPKNKAWHICFVALS